MINDVPAMEMKLADPPIDGGGGTVLGGSTMRVMYWHLDYCVDADGNKYRCKKCREGHTNHGICAIEVSLPTTDNDIHVATWFDGDGTIKGMEIESANMSSDVKESFLELVEKGTITFEENCPITNPELLAVLKTNYIPAGTYPIKLEKDNFVITISE